MKDKVVIVTGAGQGLGEKICEVLAKDGAIVMACDIQKEKVANLAHGLENAEAHVLDVTKENDVRQVVRQIINSHGRIDALVNNAGVDVTKPLEALSVEEWDKVLAVNLRGPFLTSKIVYAHMLDKGSGHIVNIASTASKRVWTEAAAYHASKWGLLGFTHAIHAEARRHGIKVTAVVAGGMRTPFIMERFPDTDPGVLQDPKNVAEVVRYVLQMPEESVIPEVMVLPMGETSWP